MSLFDLNGPLMDALRKFSDIVLYNILFCVTSLPIVTAGAALASLCEGMDILASGEDSDLSVVRMFFSSFKRNFKRATALWLLCLLAVGLLAAMRFATRYMPGGMQQMYSIGFYILTVLFCIGYEYFFPVLAKDEALTVKEVIRNSYLYAVSALPWTIALLLGTFVIILITTIVNANLMKFGIFLWASCGFGVVGFLSAFVIRHVFARAKERATGEES